jgi:dTDP-glucose pyrophosphorylase
MKIVISAAGKGTRMLHLAKNKPKHLIQVCGRPFLYYLIRNIKEAGLSDIILVVGHMAEKFEEFLEKGQLKDLFGKITRIKKIHGGKKYQFSKPKYSITLVNQFEILGTKKYGTACPLLAAKKVLGKENFISVCGDDLYAAKDMVDLKIKDQYQYLVAIKKKHTERYGEIVFDQNNYLLKIKEKTEGNFINTALYKFTPEIFKAISRIGLSKRGEYELTDAIDLLAKKRKVKVKVVDFWLDFGNPADIMRLSKFLSKQKI